MSCYVSRLFWISLVASLCWMVVTGCDSKPKRLSPTKVNATTAAANAMTMYDANHDGKISGDELEKCQSLKAIAKNGEVTAEMISGQISQWQNGGPGRVAVGVVVFHNGKPLAGASVKLMPEKFMGTDLTPVTGTTAATGGAPMSVPTSGPAEPKGGSLGFYRVEITKEGESIPAKYNTETTLGMAVLGETSTTFNLVY
jgi:hypothetical protein